MTKKTFQPTLAEARHLLGRAVGLRVAVVGDVMLDAYLTGRIERISPEAPVPVFEVQREEHMLGGAANVAKCLVALGAKVTLCGVVGDDANAELLRIEAANTRIDGAGLTVEPGRPTILKTRIVAQRQQMIRLDREQPGPMSEATEADLVGRVREAVRDADAVVISDYQKGAVSDAVARAAIEAAGDRVPVVVDPKRPPWDKFRGATMLKPNRREAGWFMSAAIGDDAAATEAARAMVQRLDIGHALITRSEQGMTLVTGDRDPFHLPPIRREVFDPTGAGDLVGAVLALALAAGADAPTAAYLANVAASVEVTKFGAAVVTDSEILEALGESGARYERKVLTRDEAARFADEQRRAGRAVVFTNGCFDLLHLGHLAYLERSARLGDALIVGINTDASTRRLKGSGRPVNGEKDRAQLLAGLACVDAVVLFEEDTPLRLIEAVKPDVLTKGADYQKKENVVGWDIVERHGGRVELIDLVEGRSTTSMIERANR